MENLSKKTKKVAKEKKVAKITSKKIAKEILITTTEEEVTSETLVKTKEIHIYPALDLESCLETLASCLLPLCRAGMRSTTAIGVWTMKNWNAWSPHLMSFGNLMMLLLGRNL